jgi:hypothetical protein
MGIYIVPTKNAIQTTLDATLAAGASSATLADDLSTQLAGVSATNPGVFVVDRVDSNNTATPTKREYCTFTGISGTGLTGVTKNADASGTDQEHAVGAIVEFLPDVLWGRSIKTTFETEHNADGTHDTTAVADLSTEQTLTNKTLTSPTITSGVAATSLDLNGVPLILDADADTTITADTDDQIDIAIAGADDFVFKANTLEVQTGSNVDMNGTELILDADADTSITADTDDQIDVKVSGADDFQITANTLTALSGSTIATNTIAETTADSGVTIDGILLKDYNITIGLGSLIGGSLGSIADNEATSITPVSPSGFLLFRSSSHDSAYGLIEFRAAATSWINIVSADSAVEVTTGALAGTTGSDGKFTVSTHTDGKIYFENRIGAARTVSYLILVGA